MSPSPRPARCSRTFRIFAGIFIGIWCTGCTGGKSDPDSSEESSVTKKSSEKSKAENGKSQSGHPPKTADAAVTAVLQGIRNKQPQAVWEFLPASYQKDVNGLVHLFADKMDVELWTRTMTLGKRLLKLCKTRKAEILSSQVFAAQAAADPKALSSDWDATIIMAETLLASSLSDVKQMKSFDGGKFSRVDRRRVDERTRPVFTVASRKPVPRRT